MEMGERSEKGREREGLEWEEGGEWIEEMEKGCIEVGGDEKGRERVGESGGVSVW